MILLPGGTVVRSGFRVHTMHHFVLLKLCLVFSQRTCPIDFFRPKTNFLGGFVRFRCREVPIVRSGFGVHKMHHFVLPKLRLVFSQRTCPIYFFRPMCFRSCVLFFHNELAQSTSLGPKLSFWVVLRDSVAGRYML